MKNFPIQKGISFIDNNGIKKFHLGKKKLRLHLFFSMNLVTVNDCLSDTLEKGKSGINSRQQTIRQDNFNKLIFAHLNINSIWNTFDILADIIENNIDILMISKLK